MPTLNKTYLLQEGFNKVWNRIENCQFIPAPYDNEINTGYLFAAKRPGTQEYVDMGTTALRLGVYTDSLKSEKLCLTDINVSKFSEGTHSSVGSLTETGSNSFAIKGSPGGTVEATGTCTSGTPTTLTDSGASWTVNEFAGKYIWLSSGKGIGDIKQITQNTSDTITVTGWSDGESVDSTTTYSIYPFLANESMLVSNSSEVKFYDGTTLQNAGISAFDKAIEWDGRNWYVRSDAKSIISYSYVGLPFAIESFLDTGFGDVVDITVFGEYLVIGKESGIIAVKKDMTAEGITVYSLANIVTSIGVAGKNAMGEYDNGLYFIGNDIDLYSVDIVAQQDGTIKGKYMSQGKVLRGYLDRISNEFNFNMFQHKGDFFIIASNSELSYEFQYSAANKGWLVGIYAFPITDNRTYSATLFRIVGEKIAFRGGLDDFEEKFMQFIGMTFGVENQFAMHRISFIKYLIGALKDTYIAVKINAYKSFNKFESSYKDFPLTSLISKAQAEAEDTFGGAMFGEQTFGGSDDGNSAYAEVAVIMDKCSNVSQGNLHELIISDKGASSIGFQLGGVYFEYIDFSPHKQLPEMTMPG